MSTTPMSSTIESVTAEQAADAIGSLMSEFDGEHEEAEAQTDESEEIVDEIEDESESEEFESDGDAADEDESDYDESDEYDDEVEEEEVEEIYAVKVNGEEIEVSIDELKAGYSRESDYTRKTQEVAKQRKEAEAELKAVRQERQQYAHLLKGMQEQLEQSVEPKIDMDRLYEEDPIEWARQNELQRQSREKLMAVKAEQDRLTQLQKQEQTEATRQYLESQKTELLSKIPDLKSPDKAMVKKKNWIKAGQDLGFSEEEVNNFSDHRILYALELLANQTKVGEKMKNSKAPTRRIRKSVKPGSAPNNAARSKSQSRRKSRQRLVKTGRAKDAAAIIEEML